jgi:Domain of unknown function (DUF4303)
MPPQPDDDLFELIFEASRKVFTSVIDEYGADSLCAFALYSDAGAMTVMPSINTKTHLERCMTTYPDDADYYRWSTAEWAHEAIHQEEFTAICEHLTEELGKLNDDNQFEIFRNNLYATCIDVLMLLKKEHLFGDAIVLFAVSDDEDDERDIAWVRLLNSPELASEFESWLVEQ